MKDYYLIENDNENLESKNNEYNNNSVGVGNEIKIK